MTRRFDVERVTGSAFAASLDRIQMERKTFGRIFGVGEPKLIDGWIRGTVPIPYWVGPVLRILEEIPAAIPVARHAANDQILRDRTRPELGDYPFRERR